MNETELAKSLKEREMFLMGEDFALDFDGLIVTEDPISLALKEDPKRYKSLLDFVKEIKEKRHEEGNFEPLSLLGSLIVFSGGDKSFSRIKLLKDKTVQEIDELDQLMTLFKRAANPRFRKDYLAKVGYFIPDMSYNFLDKDQIINLLQLRGVTQGVMVDLGCGIGSETVEWVQKSKLTVIGVERQYNSPWYDEHWLVKDPQLHFTQGDFKKGIPLKDNVADAVVLAYVTNYVPEDGIALGLQEVKRLLRPGGILAVGPQMLHRSSLWRVFERTQDKNIPFQELDFKTT